MSWHSRCSPDLVFAGLELETKPREPFPTRYRPPYGDELTQLDQSLEACSARIAAGKMVSGKCSGHYELTLGGVMFCNRPDRHQGKCRNRGIEWWPDEIKTETERAELAFAWFGV